MSNRQSLAILQLLTTLTLNVLELLMRNGMYRQYDQLRLLYVEFKSAFHVKDSV